MRFASLILCVAIAGCGGGTSLDGPFECSGTTCTSGQVCTFTYYGVDAGVGSGPGGAYYCTSVPSGCDLVDCEGSNCASCIGQLCYPTAVIDVVGRMVRCQGQ